MSLRYRFILLILCTTAHAQMFAREGSRLIANDSIGDAQARSSVANSAKGSTAL